MLPWLRIELLLRSILTTRWDEGTWAVLRREISRLLAMRRQAAKDGWWDYPLAARRLRAALGFLQIAPTEPELRLLHQWLTSGPASA